MQASRLVSLVSRLASRRLFSTVALYLFSEVIFFAKVSKDGVFIMPGYDGILYHVFSI